MPDLMWSMRAWAIACSDGVKVAGLRLLGQLCQLCHLWQGRAARMACDRVTGAGVASQRRCSPCRHSSDVAALGFDSMSGPLCRVLGRVVR
jgi:hypothetical protein